METSCLGTGGLLRFFTIVNALILLPPGEAGLLLTQIVGHHPFLGYRGARELSERKLVRNVRRRGDVYFNTGDVLAMDQEGFLYFRDRLGDTFRSGPLGTGRADGGGFQILRGSQAEEVGFLDSRGAWLLHPEGAGVGQSWQSYLVGGGVWWARGRASSLPGLWSPSLASTPQMER